VYKDLTWAGRDGKVEDEKLFYSSLITKNQDKLGEFIAIC
jgi:hypothetical protein